MTQECAQTLPHTRQSQKPKKWRQTTLKFTTAHISQLNHITSSNSEYALCHSIFPKTLKPSTANTQHLNNAIHNQPHRHLNANKSSTIKINKLARRGGIMQTDLHCQRKHHQHSSKSHLYKNVYFTSKNQINFNNPFNHRRKPIPVKHKCNISNHCYIENQPLQRVHNAFQQRQNYTQYCYQQQRKKNPDLAGKYSHKKNIKILCWNIDGGLNRRYNNHHNALQHIQEIGNLRILRAQESIGLKGGHHRGVARR